MMLRFSLDEPQGALLIEQAVKSVLEAGLRTGDIFSVGCTRVNTQEMGDAVAKALSALVNP
jgi:3-isopropylmalate dehydrogenase